MLKKLFFALFFFNLCAFSQVINNKETPGNGKIKNVMIDQKPGHIYINTITKDGKSDIEDIDFTEEMDIIVEFKEEPLFIKQKFLKMQKISAESYKNRFVQFSNDFEKIRKNISAQLGVNLRSPQIKDTYYKLFFGMSMHIQRGLLPGIQSLEYIKKVQEDIKMKADLAESVPLIKANEVWSQYGNKGEGIVIAIIDCGIDYNHPALGKGFGKGFKVIGGYDFVYNDNDPMDDNGHGTHVAGIVAGNNEKIQGVAPNASLLAYKVLDASGSGFESNIISAVERAADPNHDGLTDDKADIINMSLGGDGTPDDALSIASDNATACGIVVCVAAGNNGGIRFKSISSPGNARSVITVGASDKKDVMASFSSKGPNTDIYTIKPDLLAPGVSISSSLPNNSYGSNDGTSMACPHVAGVCALLKKTHPKWTPEEIKSAIMITAKDLGYEAMVQGAGRIDALAAIKTPSLAIPASLSLGLDDVKQPIWNKADTITIKNLTTKRQNYSIETGNIPNGITITAQPGNFSILPGDSLKIYFIFKVDNNIVDFNYNPNNPQRSYSFSGNINVKGDSSDFHIPWALVKSSRILLKSDIATRFIVTNDQITYSPSGRPVDQVEVLIEPGEYDICAITQTALAGAYGSGMDLKINYKQKIKINNADTIVLKSTEVKNSIRYKWKDENGSDLGASGSGKIQNYSFFAKFDKYMMTITGSSFLNISCTDLPSDLLYYISAATADTLSNTAWIVNSGYQWGINKSVELTNDYSKYFKQLCKVKLPDQIREPFLKFCPTLFLPISSTVKQISTSLWANFRINNNSTINIMPNPDPAIVQESFTFAVYSDRYPQYLYNPSFINTDSIGFYMYPPKTNNIYTEKAGGVFEINPGLIYPDNYYENNYQEKGVIMEFSSFYGLFNERRESDVFSYTYPYPYSHPYTFKLYDDKNNLLKQGPSLEMYGQKIKVPPGKYRTEIENPNYYIQNVQGKASLKTNYNIALVDPNPPEIKSLQIRNSKGVPAGKLTRGESARVYLAAYDHIYYTYPVSGFYIKPVLDDSTKIYAKYYGKKNWTELKVNKLSEDTLIGCYYSADLSDFTKTNFSGLDLKLVLYDKSGNNLEYILEPAVAVGDTVRKMAEDEIPDTTKAIVKSYVLYNNYPNPFNPGTTISYSIPEKAKVKIEIFNILGQKVITLSDEIMEAGDHKIEWNARNYSGGVYFCRMNATGTKNFEKTMKLILIK
jgi:hypothetical protein